MKVYRRHHRRATLWVLPSFYATRAKKARGMGSGNGSDQSRKSANVENAQKVLRQKAQMNHASTIISKSEFAAQLRRHPSAVSRWIADGHLTAPALREDGTIDLELGLAQLGARLDPTQQLGLGDRSISCGADDPRARRLIEELRLLLDDARVWANGLAAAISAEHGADQAAVSATIGRSASRFFADSEAMAAAAVVSLFGPGSWPASEREDP